MNEWREKQVQDYVEIVERLKSSGADAVSARQIAFEIWKEFQRPNLKAQEAQDRRYSNL